MSHVVEIKTEIRDKEALRTACRRLNWPAPEARRVRFYQDEVEGEAVELPGWTYPVVFDLRGGVRFDNYQGRWGDESVLRSLLQNYAVAKATLEARRVGHSVVGRKLDDGRIKLTVTPQRQAVPRCHRISGEGTWCRYRRTPHQRVLRTDADD